MNGFALAVCVALGIAVGGCTRDGPNLVIVSLDTTRADRLGAYGYEGASTPHVDRLAQRGFVFRNHMTPVPITLPAHTSLFTGVDPPVHGVRDNVTFRVPPEATTLAEVLSGAGFDTAAFVGAFPMAAEFGIDQGFDHYDDDVTPDDRDRAVEVTRRAGVYFDERRAGEVVDRAIAWHREHRSRRPFFTFLHFFDPHQPLIPPPPWDLRFRSNPYDGEIAYADEQIGRFLAFLDERGELENTIVVVTADHGEGMGEHGELTHSVLLHQATLHIPLVIAGPGIPAGSTEEWTASPQVFATLLEILAVEAPSAESPRGASLVPLLRSGGAPLPGAGAFEAYFETIAPRTTQGWAQLAGWMEGDWRFVHAPRPELYDLAADPDELDDRYERERERAARLEARLRIFLDQNERRTVAETKAEVDPEVRERLAALGYTRLSADAIESFDDMLDVGDRVDPKDRVADVSLFSEAKSALAAEDWDRARLLHEELVRRSPESAHAWHGFAVLAARAGKPEEALERIAKAIRLEPDDRMLRMFRGAYLVEIGRPAEGLEELLAIHEIEPSVEVRLWIGAAHDRKGDGESAKTWYSRGLELEPGHRWLRLYLANQLASEGALDEAEPIFEKLVADEPYFPLAFFNYALLLVERGDEARARPLLERARRLAPQHAPTRALWARLHDGAPPS